MMYVGLMSGTSLDGIDAAVVDFSQTKKPALLGTYSKPLPMALRTQLTEFHTPGFDEITRMGKLDHTLGNHFAEATLQLLSQSGLSANNILAIGSHGQTLRHHPHDNLPFTLQIGDPNIIAVTTGITTVADFRRRDMAAHGQGAPLAPAFHQYMFAHEKIPRAIVNIGGIANITLLIPGKPIIGYDTGPGNCLLDAWCEKHTGKSFDKSGDWASSGKVNSTLLQQLLGDPYFARKHPKSTGREYFNLQWVTEGTSAENTQATLLMLSAKTIIDSIHQHMTRGEIIVCGGGAHNTALMNALQSQTQCTVSTTQAHGVDPDWIEAMAFAWFAKLTLEKKPGNIPSVTGATRPVILGGVYYAL